MSSRRTVLTGLMGAAAGLVAPRTAFGGPRREQWIPHEALNGDDPGAHFYFGAANGRPQGWSAHNAGRPYSCKTSANGKLLRLELHAGDQWQAEIAASPLNERSMVQAGYSQSDILPLSRDVWWAFSFLVEPGPPVTAPAPGYDWVIFADIHSEYSTTHARSVPIQFELRAGDFVKIQAHGDFSPKGQNFIYSSPTPLVRDRWRDVVVRANMAPDNANGHGGADVWIDGKQVCAYAGPLGFARDLPYVQYQIYRNSPNPKTVARESLAIRYANHDVVTRGDLSKRVRSHPAFPTRMQA
jgi:hypothetical protein